MSKEIANQEISEEIINSLILTGDMSKLTAGQQTQYYNAVCKSVGINPLTQPFAIITLQGKKTLYATKGCTQQLSDSRGINTEIKERKTVDTIYMASCRATAKDGRFTDDDGIVSIVGLKGVELANAMMKAVTKAKRRAVLALCGLGMPDETEVEDMPHAAAEQQSEPGKSRVESIVDQHKDVQDAETKPVTPKEEPKKAKKEKPVAPVAEPSSDPAIQYVTGVITGQPRTGEVNGKTKYLFKIEDKEYGTFDTDIVTKVMEVVDMQQKKPDLRFLVKFGYTVRPSAKTAGLMFQDITSFAQVTTDEVEVPI